MFIQMTAALNVCTANVSVLTSANAVISTLEPIATKNLQVNHIFIPFVSVYVSFCKY